MTVSSTANLVTAAEQSFDSSRDQYLAPRAHVHEVQLTLVLFFPQIIEAQEHALALRYRRKLLEGDNGSGASPPPTPPARLP